MSTSFSRPNILKMSILWNSLFLSLNHCHHSTLSELCRIAGFVSSPRLYLSQSSPSPLLEIQFYFILKDCKRIVLYQQRINISVFLLLILQILKLSFQFHSVICCCLRRTRLLQNCWICNPCQFLHCVELILKLFIPTSFHTSTLYRPKVSRMIFHLL